MKATINQAKWIFRLSLLSVGIGLIAMSGPVALTKGNVKLTNDLLDIAGTAAFALVILSILFCFQRKRVRKQLGEGAADEIRGMYIFSKVVLILAAMVAALAILFFALLFMTLSDGLE